MHRIALLMGIFGGLAWVSLAFYPPECVPVTEASEVICSRLWTLPLAAMLVGAGALFSMLRPVTSGITKASVLAIAIGFAMMAGGNAGEYWLAYGLPHQGGAGALVRSLLWMSVLAGWLIALVAAVVAGKRLRNPEAGSGRPRWLSLLLVLPLPLTFAFALLGPGLFVLPIGVLGVLIGSYGLAVRNDQLQAADAAGS